MVRSCQSTFNRCPHEHKSPRIKAEGQEIEVLETALPQISAWVITPETIPQGSEKIGTKNFTQYLEIPVTPHCCQMKAMANCSS
jgi:hypothetical protein